jgi:hypothetical protein
MTKAEHIHRLDFRLYLVLGFVVLVGFVHFFLRPFQMAHYSTEDYLFVNSAYLVLATISASIHFLVAPKLWENRFLQMVDSAKGRLAIFSSLLLLTGVFFFFFKIGFGYYDFSLQRILTGVGALAGMSAIPLLVWLVIEKNSQSTGVLDGRLVEISESHGQVLVNEVLYVYSDKNYVVWVCERNGELKEYKVRETLRSVEHRVSGDLTRTHRAFLVNREKVKSIQRNHSSYEILLYKTTQKVPLSRSFRSNF